MASKARFHKVKIYTGHGSKEVILPANTHYDIKDALENETVRLEFIQSDIWKVVKIQPENTGVVFFITDDDLVFHQKDYGFEYLKAQFRKEYNSAIEETIPKDF